MDTHDSAGYHRAFREASTCMEYLQSIDYETLEFGDLYDELPLWSARFGLMLLDRVPLKSGITILDVGAGTGFMTVELAQRCGANTTVIAVDPWMAAMKRLCRKVEFLGLKNVQTVFQDAAMIDMPDESVDLIVSNLGINNFETPQKTLRSCFRVAKPGADLFLTTNLIGHMHEFYAVYREILVELGMTDQVPSLDTHINHRATMDSVRTQLENAGFQFVDAVTDTFQERYVDGSSLLRHHFVRLGFIPAWTSIIPLDKVEATFSALEDRLNAIAVEQGGLSLTVPTACLHVCKPETKA